MNRLARFSLLFLGLSLPSTTAAAGCPSIGDTARLALAILERRPLPPPPVVAPADAACARDRFIATMSQPWGDQIGWKLQAGEDGTPLIGGVYFGTLRLRAGETFWGADLPAFPADYGTAPVLAAGLLIRIRYDGVGEVGDDHVSLLRHVDAMMPFLDLGDRVYGPDAPWTNALLLSLNLGTRFGVAGAPIHAPPTPAFARALGAMTVTLGDGLRTATGGRGPLGHPLDAFGWLAREMREAGRRLQVGEYVVVMLGPALPAAGAGVITLTFGGLDERPVGVAVRFE
jgi:hypothetical protein